MNVPQPGDYIDIHTHGGIPSEGIFILENLMAHEEILPENIPGVAFTSGIHPWFLNESNYKRLLSTVKYTAGQPEVIAVGEAGFDKLRGPSFDLQRKVFREQVGLSESHLKPVIIHCVRAWDELLAAHKNLKPSMPWLIHGFRGNTELATQLISKGMYVSFWFDFAIRQESGKLFRSLPKEKIFLETDGANVVIREIYKKVAIDMDITVDELKATLFSNFFSFFNFKTLTTE